MMILRWTPITGNSFFGYLVVIMLSVASLFGSSVGCNKDHSAIVGNTNTHNQDSNNTDNTKGTKMKIKIGSTVFNATLFDNATATAFKAMLPLTLEMDELNGNEKKCDFSNALPTNSSNPYCGRSGKRRRTPSDTSGVYQTRRLPVWVLHARANLFGIRTDE